MAASDAQRPFGLHWGLLPHFTRHGRSLISGIPFFKRLSLDNGLLGFIRMMLEKVALVAEIVSGVTVVGTRHIGIGRIGCSTTRDLECGTKDFRCRLQHKLRVLKPGTQ
jgi:nitrate reductase gamma subunit